MPLIIKEDKDMTIDSKQAWKHGLEDVEEEICTCCRTEALEEINTNLENKVKELQDINLEREEIYLEAINKWGHKLQIIVAIEELSELQKELCKYSRGYANKLEIVEEIADVEIMLEQLKLIFDIFEGVERQKTYKIKRLEEKLY